MKSNFLTKITFILNIFKESFIALVPYLFLSSFIILLSTLLSIFEIQIGLINTENIKAVPHATTEMLPFFLLISITYHLAKRTNENTVISLILSILIFSTIIVLQYPNNELASVFSDSLSFTVFFIPFFSVFILKKTSSFTGEQSNSLLAERYLSNIFRLILPFLITYFLSVSFITIIINYFSNFDVLAIDYLSGLPDFSLLVIRSIVEHLLWFFGIHGSNTFDLLLDLEFLKKSIFPNIEYKQFYDLFVINGGAGASLSLIFAIFLSAKDKHSKRIAKLAVPFAIFNINEILIFGLPIIFNRYLLIPFILVPLSNLIISYNFVSYLEINFIEYNYSWITPIFINAYLATENLSLLVFQLVLVILGTVIYMPFVRMYASAQSSTSHIERLAEKLDITTALESGEGIVAHKARTSIIQSNFELAKTIELLNENKLRVFYQPKVNIENLTCDEYEGLLRLELSDGKIVGPYFLSNIENSGLAPIIDLWVCREVNKDIKKWPTKDFQPQISINLHPDTLARKDVIKEIIDTTSSDNINFEIIERSYLSHIAVNDNLHLLRDNGFAISIDDFGEGYTSLSTLIKIPFSHLKIDRSLIEQIHTSDGYSICKHITDLCKDVGGIVVAEGVETKEQLDFVKKIGIKYVQGFYFSPALEFDEIIKYTPIQ